MSEMIVHQFAHCLVRIFPNTHYLETIFKDGTVVSATPNYDDESIARAVSLGYGDDLWRMTRDHEVMHTFLAEHAGKPYSPTLWGVAHHKYAPKRIWQPEEAGVLWFQKALNDDTDEPLVVEARALLKQLDELPGEES